MDKLYAMPTVSVCEAAAIFTERLRYSFERGKQLVPIPLPFALFFFSVSEMQYECPLAVSARLPTITNASRFSA